MRLRVEDPSIEFRPNLAAIIGRTLEQQIEILERFSQKERLHLVSVFHVFGIFYVIDGGVTLGKFGEVLEGVKYRPSPILILFFSRDGEHVEKGLDGFGAQKVVTIGRLDVNVILDACGMGMEGGG